MTDSERVLVEQVIEVHRPQYTAKDVKGRFFGYAILGTACASACMAGMDAGNITIVGGGGVGVLFTLAGWVSELHLIESMVTTRATTDRYEYYDNLPDDNLIFPDEPKPDPTAYKLFDQWGVDVDKFGRFLSNEIKEGKQITRDELAEASRAYRVRAGRSAFPNITKDWKSGDAQSALMQVGFVDSIAKGEVRYMLPAQKLLDYRIKA